MWLEMGSWNRISQHAMVPLLVPVGETGSGEINYRKYSDRSCPSTHAPTHPHTHTHTHTHTEAEPALVHVDGEGGDESEAEVVAQRPGVGVGAEVPAHQGAVNRRIG